MIRLIETDEKKANIILRDQLIQELAQANEQGGKLEKDISQVNEQTSSQQQRNDKLTSILVMAEKGNVTIRNTLENCREQLNTALQE